MKKSLNLRRSLTGLALGIRLAFGGLNLFAQTPNLQTTVENAKTSQVQRIQLLQERLEQIQKELTELKHVNSTQLETDRAIPAKASVPSPALSEATEPVVSDSFHSKVGAVRFCRLHLAYRQRPYERYSVRNQVLYARGAFRR
jgi:hypothetical protein